MVSIGDDQPAAIITRGQLQRPLAGLRILEMIAMTHIVMRPLQRQHIPRLDRRVQVDERRAAAPPRSPAASWIDALVVCRNGCNSMIVFGT